VARLARREQERRVLHEQQQRRLQEKYESQ
jgi:hypothetical protein